MNYKFMVARQIIIGIMVSLLAGLSEGRIWQIDNTNYRKYIANSTKVSVAVFCTTADDQTDYNKFFTIWSELSLQYAAHTIFGICDTQESSEFLEVVQAESFPVILLINMGVVHHTYDVNKFTEYGYLRKYLKYYSKMDDKKVILPKAFLEVPASHAPSEKPTKIPEEEVLEDTTEPPKASLWDVAYAKATALVITSENQPISREDVQQVMLIIMVAPIVSGLIFLLAGFIIERMVKKPKTNDQKGKKKME